MKNEKKTIRPGKLELGDKVGVVAPAGAVDAEVLEKGLDCLKLMGLTPVLGRYVLSRHKFCAGTDVERAKDLMSMFADKKIKAIFCARGGYGVNRVIPLLNLDVIRKNPKIVVGASDITLLLIYLHQKSSLVAFHGPMVAGNFGRHPMRKSKKQFFRLLTGDTQGRKLTSPQARTLKSGVARGYVIGGCLTLLCRSLKTPWEVQTRGKILLIEDVNEAPYRIDGMLWQLKTAGKFDGIKGIVFGEMVNCQAPTRAGWALDDVVRDVFAGVSYPIMINFPVGHGTEMWTIPFGVEACLDTRSKSLEFKDCGVI